MESKNEKLFLLWWNCCRTVQSVANSRSTASDTIACEPSNYGTSSTFNCDVLEMSTRKQTSSSLIGCQQQRQHICMNWYFAEVNEQKILISFQCRRPTNDRMSLVLPHVFVSSPNSRATPYPLPQNQSPQHRTPTTIHVIPQNPALKTQKITPEPGDKLKLEVHQRKLFLIYLNL